MGAGESNPAAEQLALSGREAIHNATAAARRFGDRVGLDSIDAPRLAIVVEELVTNLYDHGGLSEDDEFTLEIGCDGAHLRLVICDRGSPFDPASAIGPDVIPERGGGAGLALVKAWASSTKYESDAGLNRLVVMLPIETQKD